MSSSDPTPNVASSDRRSGSRQPSLERIQVIISADSLTGTLENTSPEGMFVILDEPLQVEVAVGSDEEEERTPARLTRVASLPGHRSGWGLELITDSSAA